MAQGTNWSSKVMYGIMHHRKITKLYIITIIFISVIVIIIRSSNSVVVVLPPLLLLCKIIVSGAKITCFTKLSKIFLCLSIYERYYLKSEKCGLNCLFRKVQYSEKCCTFQNCISWHFDEWELTNTSRHFPVREQPKGNTKLHLNWIYFSPHSLEWTLWQKNSSHVWWHCPCHCPASRRYPRVCCRLGTWSWCNTNDRSSLIMGHF